MQDTSGAVDVFGQLSHSDGKQLRPSGNSRGNKIEQVTPSAGLQRSSVPGPPARGVSGRESSSGPSPYPNDLSDTQRFWDTHLADAPESLLIATEGSCDSGHELISRRVDFTLSCEQTEALEELVAAFDTTLLATLISTWATVLSRTTGQDSIIVGATSGRTGGEQRLALTTVPLHVRLTNGATVRHIAHQVDEILAFAETHQEALGNDPDLASLVRARCQTTVQLLHKSGDTVVDAGTEFAEGTPDGQFSLGVLPEVWLSLLCMHDGTKLRVSLIYAGNRVESRSAARLLSQWIALLDGVTYTPTAPLGRLPLLTEEDRDQILHGFNANRVCRSQDETVHELVEAQVERTPDSVAVIYEGHSLTYAELDKRAEWLARRIVSLGISPDSRVGICVERSLDLVIGLLATLKAGAAYVPLDPTYPTERIHYMVAGSAPRVLLVQERLKNTLQDASVPLLSMDTLQDELNKGDLTKIDRLNVKVSPRNLAYVIYTSGSTGRPKGAMNEHRAVVNRLRWMEETYHLGPNERVLQKTPFSFDVSVWEFFWTLMAGSCLVVARPEGHKDPFYLRELIDRAGVTTLHFVPSMLQSFLSHVPERACPSLSHVVCSGEELPGYLRDQFFRCLPRVRLSNLYGPTEAAVDVTAWECQSEDGGMRVPIGRPIANVQIYILDAHMEPVPITVVGELYIGGVAVGRGYVNRPELTAERFVSDPFSSTPGERMYRTGDLCKWRSDGTIEYLGRNDHQVKIRGFRIELGEIEDTIRRHPHVKHAAIVARRDRHGEQVLHGYLVPNIQRMKADEAASSTENGSDLVRRWKAVFEEVHARTLLDADTSEFDDDQVGELLSQEQIRRGIRNTADRVVAMKPTRVLEIGCGVGSLLEALAPRCLEYFGIDISAVAIDHLQRRITRRSDLKHATVVQCSALELECESESYDTIVIDSVVHAFPDINYLHRVIVRALDWLAPGGRIFIGNVRHLGLRKVFHAIVELQMASSFVTAAALRASIENEVESERELSIDPQYFVEAFGDNLRCRVQICPRRTGKENLLERFHYDVVLENTADIKVAKSEQTNWHDGLNPMLWLSERVETRNNQAMSIRGITNASLTRDIATWKLIECAEESCTVGALRDIQESIPRKGEDPETLWQLAESQGFQAVITWQPESPEGRFILDLNMGHVAAGTTKYERRMSGSETMTTETRRAVFANDPWGKSLAHQLIPKVREFLRGSLPAHMIPAVLVVLNELPLSANGKLDRRALPDPGGEAHMRQPYEAPRDVVEERIAEIWQNLLGVERIGRHDNFFELGGHSLLIVELVERLRRGGIDVDVVTVFESPTIAALRHLLDSVTTEETPNAGLGIPEGSEFITSEMFPLLNLEPGHIERIVATVPGGAANLQDIYPLTPLQEGLLFHHIMSRRGDAYLSTMLFLVEDEWRLSLLFSGLQSMVDRHDALRTAICWEQLPKPVQIVYRKATLIRDELILGTDRDPLDELKDRMRPELQRMDLRQAPLLRVLFAKDPYTSRVYVLLQLHHLALDRVALEVLMLELRSHLENIGSELLAPVAYRHHVVKVLSYKHQLKAEQFFRSRLAAIDEPTTPFGLLNVHEDGGDFDQTSWRVGEALSRRIRAQAQRFKVTPAALFHAAWGVVVGQTSGRNDVVFGTVLLGRMQETALAGQIVGMCINTLPLRVRLNGVSARDLLEATHRELRELVRYELMSLLHAQSCSGVPAAMPLFTSLLNCMATSGNVELADGVRVIGHQWRANYPISLSIEDRRDRFLVTAQTDKRVDPHRIVGYFRTSLRTLVDALETEPARRVAKISILPTQEWLTTIRSGQETKTAKLAQNSEIREVFELQVLQVPERLAVVAEDGSLTYRELNARANRLARWLRHKGLADNELVGICMDRSTSMLVGIIGVLKAGGAYVPLDPSLPMERMLLILRDAAPRMVLVSDQWEKRLSETKAELMALDRDWLHIEQFGCEDLDNGGMKDNPGKLAYVIYTSGSTGMPKGVMVEQRSVVNHWRGLEELYRKPVDCRYIALNAPFTFDASVQQWIQLLSGCTLFLIPQKYRVDPPRLIEFLDENRIEGIDTTPSQLHAWIEAGLFERAGKTIRTVLVGGEAIDAPLWQRMASHESVTFYNVYGPTECTVDSTSAKVGLGVASPHIGLAMANVQGYVLDECLRPAPSAVSGEIYIGGAGVARGYLDQPRLTAERFIADPFALKPGARMYRTGDLGRWRNDGVLDYLGRNDGQVKVRGFRIELGEIETQLARHRGVKEAVVTVREEPSGEKRLVGYVIPDSGAELSAEALRRAMEEALPSHMVPAAFVVLERLPLTSSGKLDRRALPHPGLGDYAIQEYEAPQNEIEEILAGIWQQLLRVDRVGRQDNFFALGGHSLLMMQLKDGLGRVGLQADIRQVFENPRLADLANALRRDRVEGYVVPPNLIPPESQGITPAMLPLVQLDDEAIERIVRAVPGGAANVQDVYPLVALQEGILFHHLKDGAQGDPYIVATLLSITSRARLDELIATLQVVIDRYDVLRTAVLWADLPQPVQVVYRHATLQVDVVESGGLLGGLERIKELMKPGHQSIELQRAPLMRLTITPDISGERWYALLQVHHIVCDHETTAIIIADVVARLEGHAKDRHELIPYRSHVGQALACARSRDGEAFFRDKLREFEHATAPFEVLETTGSGGDVAEFAEEVGRRLSVRVRAQARRLGVSAATLFHAACGLVVAGTTGRDDIVYGTVLLGRLQGGYEAKQIVGMTINTLPLRLRLRGVTAQGLVEQTQRELVELLNYEQVSLATAKRCSGIAGAAPLFTLLLNYRHSVSAHQDGWSNASGIQELAVQERTNYPIVISVDDLGTEFTLTAQTDRQLNPQRMTGLMSLALRSLVDALEQAPKTPALALPIIALEERRQVIEVFNATQAPFPRDLMIHDLFECYADHSPDATAVTYENTVLTYGELNRSANQLAHFLIRRGARRGDIIPMLLSRGPILLVAQLAALKCGGVYLPIDPKTPAERQRFLLKDCGAQFALCDRPMDNWSGGQAVQWIDCSGPASALSGFSTSNPRLSLDPCQPAYVMYTSGSTGDPKGVTVPHQAVNRLVKNNRFASIESTDCIAHCSNPTFDAATFEVWGALLNGAKLAIMSDSTVLGAELFGEELRRAGVTILWLTVGLFVQYAAKLGEIFGRLRYLMTGGDVVDPGPVAEVLKENPPQHFLNAYGPTEGTTFTTTQEIFGPSEAATTLPIGRPISNTRVYVLDEYLQPVPLGLVGHMYVAGDGVALGYLNRPDLTAERFLPEVFSDHPGSRMYKTGDLGRWRPDGALYFMGRSDRQVKIRGFRIELDEIEAQLTRHAKVKEAAVMTRDDLRGGKRIVAFVVPKGSLAVSDTLGADLNRFLRNIVPEYMVPETYTLLERFPLTSNGKVNRRALSVAESAPSADSLYKRPVGDVEEALARIWEEVLHAGAVSRDDNFFERGGHSLLALKALLMINKSIGRVLSITELYRNPTPQLLAAHIGGKIETLELVDLSKEARFDFRHGTVAGARRNPPQNVLLTGATGFVGRFLLAQLLTETRSTVHCLVRAASRQEATARVKQVLEKWDLWKDEFQGRIVGIPGDLSRSSLGLDVGTETSLSNRIDAIYHCATSMNHLETYAMAKPTNVGGAKELLKLATRGRPKTVNYISTLSVFSSCGKDYRRLVTEESRIEDEKHLTSDGYAASKWVGEKIFLDVRSRGIPCNIFRLGLIWADSRKGRYDELQREHRIFESCLLTGCGIKEYQYRMPPTPVDYVAAAITYLALRHADGNGIFHITAESEQDNGIFERCNDLAGTGLRLLPTDEWINEMRRLSALNVAVPAMPILDIAFPERNGSRHDNGSVSQTGTIQYSCARTHEELESAGIIAPRVDDDLLSTYIERIFAMNAELRGRYRMKVV